MKEAKPYSSTHKVRFVTAASLFDGHDASINIMRRILQSSGAEVIHLGHNRSVADIVHTAIQEDVQGIAISSYQGGHIEYFKYMIDLLKEFGAEHIKVFGGGGGVIVPEEIETLHKYGVSRIFSVDDGRSMGLQGMINLMIKECDFDINSKGGFSSSDIKKQTFKKLARAISALENHQTKMISFENKELKIGEETLKPTDKKIPVIGITGTGGAGKSSITDEIIRRFLTEYPDKKLAVISIDPSKRKTGGALLGDRIRMNALNPERVYMRSLATRSDNRATSSAILACIELCKVAQFDVIIVETSGIGQSDTEIVDIADLSFYVMTSEYGASTQLEKINMLDLADVIVLNKFEKRGSQDALRDIRKQYKRTHHLWEAAPSDLPVYPTIAAQFNDEGVNRLFAKIIQLINKKYELNWLSSLYTNAIPEENLYTQAIIPPKRHRYLSEISDAVRSYHSWIKEQVNIAKELEEIRGAIQQIADFKNDKFTHSSETVGVLKAIEIQHLSRLDGYSNHILQHWNQTKADYSKDVHETKVRDTVIKNDMYSISLSGNKIPRVAFPDLVSDADKLKFSLKENLPGFFPYTAGVFPFKRENEDPTRMFAGEGTPERTNRRFHFVSEGLSAKRLSTAFDSVTLYGEDPAIRPDIYGKVGNSGVSICTLDDMKKLYSGFELTSPTTSVSMTINGPAPMILAMYMNAAIDQEVERHLKAEGKWEAALQKMQAQMDKSGLKKPSYCNELPKTNNAFGLGTLGFTGDKLVDAETYSKIKAKTLSVVRGTVQADILKEDQAQNTCIFSTEFALKMMGDIQTYFTEHNVRNYYSVSISGYHIAEAGANPISQAAFTLSNGFTFVEYYLSRGLKVDDFAHNLSFFFSNGLDPEYQVIGRVARRIWAIAMKNKYTANERSQKLKYHIQTSGRSLHAQEIQFNDIRTTLQALIAINDNCNSLHTNAYDEAITTPTEESVRRALAIQMIINKEFGMAKNENPLQGSFVIEQLTDLVEEAILTEFDRITERGGVLGAMETMYQRGKIQDESLHYETLKHTGELPIIGVNTFLDKNGESKSDAPLELIRSTDSEKKQQIEQLVLFQEIHKNDSKQALSNLKHVARTNGNLFTELMETVKVCSLGEITQALYEVGGQYRRNM